MKLRNILKLVLPVALGSILWAGCASRTITYGDAKYHSIRFGQKEDIDGLKVTTPDGTIIELTGYRNDQVQAIGIAVEAAVKSVAKSIKP